MNKTKILFLFVGLSLMAGCDSIRHTFGLDHYRADEFSVPTTPPLSLPPSYHLSPPQAPTETGPTALQDRTPHAQKALLGRTVQPLPAQTQGVEDKLLATARADATGAPEKIREIIDQEAQEEGTITGRLGALQDRMAQNLKNTGESGTPFTPAGGTA